MRKFNFKNLILHPFLFGLYPVIALLGHNITEVRIPEATRAMLLMFIGVMIIVVVLRLIFRNWQRAALAATFLLVSFLSYGYLYDFLQQTNPDLSIARHRFLIPLYLFAIGIGLWLIIKIRDLGTVTQALNLMGIVAVVFPLYQIVSHEVIRSVEVYSKKTESINSSGLVASGDHVYPDVYYIILDAYPRSDVLLDVFDYDNSAFLNQLREMGFYVAECSQSNYSKTSHALTSTLNLNYLDVLEGGDVRNLKSPATWIRFNEVKKILDSLGYTTVAFSTGFPDTELTDVDIYLEPDVNDLNMLGSEQPVGAINNFEALLISTSGLVLADALTLFDIDILPKTGTVDIKSMVELSPLRQRYVQVSHAFGELEDISALPTPKFVFAHIIAPHNPYIFASNGSFMPRQAQNREAYINQLAYVNQRMIPILTDIIENSDIPPIIIVQGDHGSSKVEYTPLRVMILNAYYLPGGGEEILYSKITPVNSFRVVLDRYFGADYGLLEDISYNSKSEEDTLDYEIVPNQCDR